MIVALVNINTVERTKGIETRVACFTWHAETLVDVVTLIAPISIRTRVANVTHVRISALVYIAT